MAKLYDIGDAARITGTFTVLSVNTDPTTVSLEVRNPAGTVTVYTYASGEITRSATGVYYRDVSLTSAGIWYYEWNGTGAVATGGKGNLLVGPSTTN